MMMRAMAGVAAASVAWSAAAGADSVDEVLARVRAARGAERLPEGKAIHLHGAGSFLGNAATIDARFDDAGRSVMETRAGVAIVNGFDGGGAWMIDLGGETRPTYLGERENTIFSANAISGWWLDERSEMRFVLDESAAEGGPIVLRFTHDDGRASGTVEIDRASWRATRWTLALGAREFASELSGSLVVGGRTFPSTVRQTSSSGEETTIEFSSGEVEEAGAGRFAMPREAEGSCRFDGAVEAGLEIKRAPTGHLLVKAAFDDAAAGWFIFDTGAGMNCIDLGIIAERGYEQAGEVPAVGVGGSVMSPLVRPVSLRVGRLTIDRPLCVGLDLKPIAAYMGEPIMGIVGYNAIACSVAEIDVQTPSVRLLDPATYELRGAEWTPMMVYERHPCFEGTIEGHRGVLKIDTGAAGARAGALTVHFEACERFELLEGRETSEATLGGVGGFVSARKGVLSFVEFGGMRHDNVQATFATEQKGAFSDPYVIANVGTKMLEGRTLVLDYEGGRAALVERPE